MNPLTILALAGVAAIVLAGALSARGANIAVIAKLIHEDHAKFDGGSVGEWRLLEKARGLELRAAAWGQLGGVVGALGIVAILVAGGLAVLG